MKTEITSCTAYFKNHPGFHRILEQMLRKCMTYGRPTGTICLVEATDAEYVAMHDFFGRPFSSPLRFNLQAFDAALQQTKFHGVTLMELLEDYFNTTIRTKKEIKVQIEHDFLQMLDRVSSESQSEACHNWLSSLKNKNNGYQLLRKGMGDGTAEPALRQACRSMDWLQMHPDQKVRLAILSAHATSDPHALDGTCLAGKLLLHLLALQAGRTVSSLAEDRDLLYYDGGILCDSIASSVTQVGLLLSDGDGEHQAFQAFRQRHESCTLTLMNLSALISASSPSGRVYLVENQMVFSQLCDQSECFHSPLICTSGQPQVAVLRLLDLLAVSNAQIFYSGDFDGEGFFIAARLMVRFSGRLHPWHMEPEDYAQTCSEVELTDSRLQPLQNVKDPRLIPAANAILKQRRAGYQELLLPLLLTDLTTTP